ncbi:50S ribosomal protein L18 [Candidatus Roizmanbacteria bacterium CG10_big_fil_rev_8_21_14_0_10_45_7]|uniref:Large ribosomal subunit protein uL18 n=1 Tax=Candidatus Roizmanbacteria bacterium CG10_big_fil_rev_8_21_14_0_10_45_7 TaxID=1974854 RepID=A0A2M8KUF2_9BACT|nr:MAG: 50S ribosomal protein L18 [Candidatus Roizmanbacteria bacterium CG10_big_fil_rev_8_21_14_0_10_45_7]
MLIKGLLKQIKKSRFRRVKRVRMAVMAQKRARLSVFRSNKHIAAQIIDDISKKTVAAVSDRGIIGNKQERAKAVGLALAQEAKKKKVTQVAFDRAWYKFHGRVRALAEGAKEGGLQF